MYLVFDTETTGLPASWHAPPSDVDNWPRIVQLAWEAFDIRGRKTGARCHVIRPDGFTIPKEAERVHGISTSIAKRTGVPVTEALDAFVAALGNAHVVVAHNFKFDASVLGAEFHRLGIRDQFAVKPAPARWRPQRSTARSRGLTGSSGRGCPNSTSSCSGKP